jgi:hypothetical protein
MNMELSERGKDTDKQETRKKGGNQRIQIQRGV